MSRKLRTENDCLNCGSTVTGKYCSECGQPNYERRESFRHILTHFITDYLHLDEKFFSSLKYLLFNPGHLTKEFNAGKRMKYVHPFRLYIFITIVFFIVQNVDNKGKKKDVVVLDTTENVITSNDTIALSKNGDVLVNKGFQTAEDTSIEQYLQRQDSLPEEERDNFLIRYFNKKNIVAEQNDFDLSKKINETFRNNIPKMMFLILPIFALILSIFFRKKRLYYVEHFYHSVYLHSFFYLYMLIFLIIAYILPDSWKVAINIVMMVGLLVYFYKSLMKVYEGHPIVTLLKIVFILGFYFISLLILVVLNAIISFLIL